MIIEIFTICEYAQPIGGSVNILYPFDTITTSELPATKSFFAVVRIRYKHDEHNEQNIKSVSLKLIGPHNNELTSLNKNDEIQTYPGKTSCINHIISFFNFPLLSLGRYILVFETEGQKYELPFYVEEKKQ